jgi:hypothetical protein
MEEKHCKWYNDEFCTNGDSPCVADYCPVVEYPELCKHREVDKDINVRSKTEEKKLADEELKQAVFILRHGSSEGLSEYIKAVLAIEREYDRQKAEIERLKKPIGKFKDQSALLKAYESLEKEFTKRNQRLKELQKNNDELVEDLANMTIYPEEAVKRIREEAAKDTAKEILGELDLFFKGNTFRKGYEFKKIDEKLKELKKRNGVEVE